ncbi:MAG: FKBP-type peptidyl-prolyl cis-trans isomerase [Planctomycetes bacterium]|nr:FKBP-type peptidyl-prolyl cis-trans isomerase [Planctomycetota bacterium]
MSHHTRSIALVLFATAFVIGVTLVGQAYAQPQPANQSQQAAAFQAPPDVAAPPADAVKSRSGLRTKVLKPGTGTDHPTTADRVIVNYTGWTTDGKMFDSTIVRNRPSTVPISGVLPGWTEGLQLMVVGETRRLWVPEKIAFNGMAGRPAGMVVFDIELVDIIPGPKAPPDVAAPPSDAEKTKSGLAWKVVKPGTGTDRPPKSSVVTVHYTGWTTDGMMFDSSVVRGKPSQFPLNQVIAGWTEGLQLMTQGEVRRFWIPEKLAYDGAEGKPKGMLVFDVELISFQK